MLKKILAAVAMLSAAAAMAAVDVNKATVADLDGVRGIGPGLSKRILDERSKGPFKDWGDLITRVQGIGPANAARYSSEGLTVDGAVFKAAPAPAKPERKAAAGTSAVKTSAEAKK